MRNEKGFSMCNVSMDQHCKDKREDHHLSSHKGPYGNCDAVLVWTCIKVWEAFRSVVDNFLGNHKVPKCWHLIETIIQTYRTIGWNVLLKVHFLHCHFWFLFTKLTDNSDNHGAKFHEEFSTMQKCYKWKLNVTSWLTITSGFKHKL